MLVTLEGLDGSGKTTVWESLQDRFSDAVFTREPTDDSWYGDAVYRSIEDDDADPLAELFLYTADHAAHLSRVIEPALERGDLVISDRYSDSRFAYQARRSRRPTATPSTIRSSTSSTSTGRSRSTGADDLPRSRFRDRRRASGDDEQVRASGVSRVGPRELRATDQARPRPLRSGRRDAVAGRGARGRDGRARGGSGSVRIIASFSRSPS